MPDLTSSRYGFQHTADSALLVLSQLGIRQERISITKAGRGWTPLRVVEQTPEPGAHISPDALIKLTVEGDGLFDTVPATMRQGGGEGEVTTKDILSVFDDALEKSASFVRLGGIFFDVRPSNPDGCARWIKLFGIDPDEWPGTKLYKLALFLPCLRYLSGRETGLRSAARLLLDLEIANIGWKPRRTLLDQSEMSLLGVRCGTLGVDFIIGDAVDDEAAMEITLRAITVEEYNQHQSLAGRTLIDKVLKLVMPYHWEYEIQWLVGDTSKAPRLGDINSILGVNSHMGAF